MAKKRQMVFVDDSGDPGFKNGASSSNFVMAAVLFMNPEMAAIVDVAIAKYRRALGWRDDYEFKFSKIRKDAIAKLLRIVAKCDFQIYAVYLNKVGWRKNNICNRELYNWATKDLLAMMPLERAIVRIDGKYDKNYRRYMRAFIRKNSNVGRHKIADFDALDSRENNLIQLADLVAGAINRSFQCEKTDCDKYMGIIKKKIVVLKNLGDENDKH